MFGGGGLAGTDESKEQQQMFQVRKLSRAMSFELPRRLKRHPKLALIYIHWYNRFTYALVVYQAFTSYIMTSLCLKAINCEFDGEKWLLVVDRGFECGTSSMLFVHAVGAIGSFVTLIVFPFYIFKKLRRIHDRDNWNVSGIHEKYGLLFTGTCTYSACLAYP